MLTTGRRFPGAATECRQASCAGGVFTLPASCASACPPAQTQPCAPYVCAGSACGGDRLLDSDCSGGRFLG